MAGGLSGKRVLTFMALHYHRRILVPVMEELKKRGARVTYFTASAEAGFEMTFLDAGIPYLHAMDFLPSVQAKVHGAWQRLKQDWQERLVKSQWSLQGVPITIQDKVIRSMVENFFCFRELIKAVKPHVCFALHELNSWGKILGYLCSEMGIPYLTFQEGLYYGHPFLYQLHVEYSTACICWGDADAEVIIQAGGDPKKIHRLGSVDLFPAIKETKARRQEIKKSLGIPEDMQVVLMLMAHANYNALDLSPLFAWQTKRGNTAIILKWHPALPGGIIQHALSKSSPAPFVFSLHLHDVYELLGIADVCVVVGNSTTGIEALAYGLPLVEIPLPFHAYSYSDRGVAIRAEGLADVGEKIDLALKHPLPKDAIEAYLDHHFAFRDEHTAKRVADLTEHILEAKYGEGKEKGHGCSTHFNTQEA